MKESFKNLFTKSTLAKAFSYVILTVVAFAIATVWWLVIANPSGRSLQNKVYAPDVMMVEYYEKVSPSANRYHIMNLDESIEFNIVKRGDWATPSEKIIVMPEHQLKSIQDSLNYYKKKYPSNDSEDL